VPVAPVSDVRDELALGCPVDSPNGTLEEAVLLRASPRSTLRGGCVVDTGLAESTAFGSCSQLKREPKGKCCTTGNFDKTSALYILIIPFVEATSARTKTCWKLTSYLVDFGPSSSDARNVKQNGTVLPERPLLHIIDKTYS